MQVRHLVRMGLSALACALSVAAAAQSAKPRQLTPSKMTWGELALLPPYCPDTQSVLGYGDATNPSPRAGYWLARLGQDFWHLHHYCWGILYVNRATTTAGQTKQARDHLYRQSINEFRYILNNSAPDFVLRPEVLVRMGDSLLKLDQLPDAYIAFEQARNMKPDYWPAYARWAEVLIKTNSRAEAKRLLEQGLAHAPDSEALRKLYGELGGDVSKLRATTASPGASASPPANLVAPAASAASATAADR